MEAVTGMPFSAAWLCLVMGLAQSCGIEALPLGGAAKADCAYAIPVRASDATNRRTRGCGSCLWQWTFRKRLALS